MGCVRGAPGDVMHGADRLLALWSFRRFDHVEDRPLPTRTCLEPGAPSLLTRLAKAHRFDQEINRRGGLRHGHGHAAKAANRVFAIHLAARPPHPPRISSKLPAKL